MNKNPIGIICAMQIELEGLVERLENCRIESECGYDFYLGDFENTPVVLVQCGVGLVNAARGTQMLVDRYSPAAIINSGIAGGAMEGLHVGDVVISTSLVQHDFNATPFGYVRGYQCTGKDGSKPTIYDADAELVDKISEVASRIMGDAEFGFGVEEVLQDDVAEAAAESGKNRPLEAGGEIASETQDSNDAAFGDDNAGTEASSAQAIQSAKNVHLGVIVSGDMFIADPKIKSKLRRDFNAAAAEMEGSAIAQVAWYAGVPFAVIRVISDLADGTAPENYGEFEVRAARLSAEIMYRVAKELEL